MKLKDIKTDMGRIVKEYPIDTFKLCNILLSGKTPTKSDEESCRCKTQKETDDFNRRIQESIDSNNGW